MKRKIKMLAMVFAIVVSLIGGYIVGSNSTYDVHDKEGWITLWNDDEESASWVKVIHYPGTDEEYYDWYVRSEKGNYWCLYTNED